MNSRRKISNVTKKDGFDNMYDVHFSINKDKRGNNSVIIKSESVIYENGILKFDPSKRNVNGKEVNGIQYLAMVLHSTQKEIKTEILKYL